MCRGEGGYEKFRPQLRLRTREPPPHPPSLLFPSVRIRVIRLQLLPRPILIQRTPSVHPASTTAAPCSATCLVSTAAVRYRPARSLPSPHPVLASSPTSSIHLEQRGDRGTCNLVTPCRPCHGRELNNRARRLRRPITHLNNSIPVSFPRSLDARSRPCILIKKKKKKDFTCLENKVYDTIKRGGK